MAKGQKSALVESIVTGTFRPDRQGRLLLEEPLPVEPPADVDEAGRKAWAELVAAQKRIRKDGVTRPWEFARLVRRFHTIARPKDEPAPMEKLALQMALAHGPGAYPDKVLKMHWLDWGRDALLGRKYWHDRETYGYWRFERGFTRKRAIARVRAAEAVYERKRLLQQIDEFNIEDWHNFWGDETLEERRALILRAGRPDLIDPETCERFGVT